MKADMLSLLNNEVVTRLLGVSRTSRGGCTIRSAVSVCPVLFNNTFH